MTNYIPADKLKAEIERRLAAYQKNFDKADNMIARLSTDGRIASLKALLPFVDSLQQERPEVDLEKEIDACWQGWLSPSNQKEVEGVLPKIEFAMYARHFYELGINAKKEE